jgi:hypothetical protein
MDAIKHASRNNVTSISDDQGGIVLPAVVGLCERTVEPNEQQQKVAQQRIKTRKQSTERRPR